MLIKVEQTGFDDILNSPIYTETRECDSCHKVYSFSYSCCYDLETVINVAKDRIRGRVYGDVCCTCRDMAEQGYSQPILF